MSKRNSPKNLEVDLAVLEAACPLDAQGGTVIGYSGNISVYQCPFCKLCYLGKSVRPYACLDNQWYDGFAQHVEWGQIFLNQLQKVYSKQLKVFAGLTDGRRLVDIGCGVGVFLAVAKQSQWEVVGIEESPHAIHFAKASYGLNYLPSLQSVDRTSMDVVRLSHVLEHIPEPVSFLNEVTPLLKPGGILAIIVPNREPLCSKVINQVRRLSTKHPKLAGAIYPNMHVLGFSPRSLVSMVTPQGFRAERVFTVSMGNRSFFPLFYDGLLNIKDPSVIPMKEMVRYWLPMFVNNLGNPFGLGEWIVSYFRKATA